MTSICLSVSLTSVVTEDQLQRQKIEDSMDSRDASSPEAFTELVHTLRESLIPPPVTVMPTTSPMARPTSFSGEAVICNGFLLQCSLYFELQSHQFTTERSKVAFIISLLTGRALQWAEGLWSSQSPRISSLEDFVKHFREVFSQPTTEVSIHDELFQLRQADSSIHEYTLRFRTLAAGSGWNEVALLSTYRRGLNLALRQHMSIYDDSVGFESFLHKAARVSQRLTACHMDDIPIASASPSRSLPAPEPMITDSYHLSVPERSRRLTQGLCLYCGSAGHQLRTCPIRPPRPAVSTIHITPDVSNMPLVDALLRYQDQSYSVRVLMDSEAAGKLHLLPHPRWIQNPSLQEQHHLPNHHGPGKTAGQRAGAFPHT